MPKCLINITSYPTIRKTKKQFYKKLAINFTKNRDKKHCDYKFARISEHLNWPQERKFSLFVAVGNINEID